MAQRVLNLESGHPTLEDARRRLLEAIAAGQKSGIKVLKVIHGYGSSGVGGVLCTGIRKSLRLRAKEGKVLTIIPGEKFTPDSVEARALLQRQPALRQDRDLNRGNPGITIVELAPLGQSVSSDKPA